MSLAMVLGVTAVLWPAALGLALVDRTDGRPSVASGLVYVAASHVCHQRPDRSFHSAGHQWPVCARCAGLYLFAPLGVALAAMAGRRGRGALARVVVVAALPTALAWMLEAGAGVAVSGLLRFLAAAPLGAAMAFALIDLARPIDRID